MRCDKCGNGAVFFQAYSGRHLCNRHLALDIEVRAKRSIRSHRWIRPGDHIAVIVSGDRKSGALLKFLKNLTADRRDVRLSAIIAGGEHEGTSGRSSAAEVIASLGIPPVELPLQEGSGTAACGNVTKIAVAVSLDDIAQGILGLFLFGNAGNIVHPPPAEWNRIPVICPFIAVPSEELARYGEIGTTGIDRVPMTSCHDILLQETRAMLEDFSRRHPATRYALLHVAEDLSSGNVAALGGAVAGPSGCAHPTVSSGR